MAPGLRGLAQEAAQEAASNTVMLAARAAAQKAAQEATRNRPPGYGKPYSGPSAIAPDTLARYQEIADRWGLLAPDGYQEDAARIILLELSLIEPSGPAIGGVARRVIDQLWARVERLNSGPGAIDLEARALSHRLRVPALELTKVLTFWARRGPPECQEDARQSIALAWLEQRPPDAALAFAIARHTVGRIWERWHTDIRRRGPSLDQVDAQGQIIADALVAVVEWEAHVVSSLDASQTWARLPRQVQRQVERKLTGHSVRGREAAALYQWARTQGAGILASA